MSFFNKLRSIFNPSQNRSIDIQNKSQSSSASTTSHSQPEQSLKKEQDQAAMIGNVKILLYLNSKAVESLRSQGIQWPEAVCALMAKNSESRDHLLVSHDRVTLSTVIKVWCQTTPIYRDKQGGICVLFEELDKETREKEDFEFLGMIDPEGFAASLCAKFGIKGKNVYV